MVTKNQSSTTFQKAAIELGLKGFYVAPLQPRTKRPISEHGIKDSVRTTREIWEMWTQCPQANIAIDLQRSGLLGIGPDSPDWLARFQEWGLPDTQIAQSGGGEANSHYYYRRPEVCPIFRINRSGDYDIQSDGYFVAPPSIHPSGNPYTWFTPLRYVEDLPEAPTWAVKMLQERVRERKAAATPPAKEHGPLNIPIFRPALPWYNGQKVATKENGEIDRSATLFALACKLAQGIATVESITEVLRDRDIALGLNKYSNRADALLRYREIAERALAEARSYPKAQKHTPIISPNQGGSP